MFKGSHPLEHTVSGKFAAMGAGFQMVSDQLTDS